MKNKCEWYLFVDIFTVNLILLLCRQSYKNSYKTSLNFYLEDEKIRRTTIIIRNKIFLQKHFQLIIMIKVHIDYFLVFDIRLLFQSLLVPWLLDTFSSIFLLSSLSSTCSHHFFFEFFSSSSKGKNNQIKYFLSFQIIYSHSWTASQLG